MRLQITKRKFKILLISVFILVLSLSFFLLRSDDTQALTKKFNSLSSKGNSTCSSDFTSSIDKMGSGDRIMGSCCSPMDLHRYMEQVTGLRKYKNIKEIPADPYDVYAKLAKEMRAHYDDKLTVEEQKAYDYAMKHSDEKGPCCCKCWRWYVYGGLAKFLIQKYDFTGEQITEVWDLSDGCGGAGEHAHH